MQQSALICTGSSIKPCEEGHAAFTLLMRVYVYPDVTITYDERDRGKQNTIHYPRLIVEVLSPGTRDYDRGGKFTYYRACPTIQEYILINTDYQTIEVFHRERADFWTLQLFRAGSTVELPGIGATFSVTSAYEDTTVPENTMED